MKQFKFKDTEKSADNVIKAIEARAKRQSNAYRLAFIAIAFLIISYILNILSVDVYEGYISHKDIAIRSVANIAIVDYHVKPGEITKEGDTLYTYLMVDWLEDLVNPFTEDVANERMKESDLRIAKYESEIIEVDNTIDSLKSTIMRIKEDILTGVKTEDELVNLNLELTERVEKSKHLKRSIGAEYKLQSKYSYAILNTKSLTTQGLSERKANLDGYGKALKYRVAYVDSKIVNIKAPHGMLTLPHEEILTFQPIGHPSMTNSHIEMVVEAKDYGEVYEGMVVDIYAGGEYLCEANVSLLGVRMADAYSHIESLLDRSTDINGKLMIMLDFKEGYDLPEKYYIHNYPVEIRHRVWGDLSRWLNIKEWILDVKEFSEKRSAL